MPTRMIAELIVPAECRRCNAIRREGEICHDLHQASKYSRWALQTLLQHHGQPDENAVRFLLPLEGESPTPSAPGSSQARKSCHQPWRPPCSPVSHEISTRWDKVKSCPRQALHLLHIPVCRALATPVSLHRNEWRTTTRVPPARSPALHASQRPTGDAPRSSRLHGAKDIIWIETDHLNPSPTAQYQFARSKLTHTSEYGEQLDGSTRSPKRSRQMPAVQRESAGQTRTILGFVANNSDFTRSNPNSTNEFRQAPRRRDFYIHPFLIAEFFYVFRHPRKLF